MKRVVLLFLCLLLPLGAARAAVSVRMGDGSLLLGEDGREIVPMGAYSDIVSLGNGLFAAERDGLYALMDARGERLSDMLYSDLRLEDAMLLACRDGLWGLLSAQGEEISAFDYTHIVPDGQGSFWAVKGDTGDLEADELFLLNSEGAQTTSGLFVRRLGDASGDGMLSVLLPETDLWGYCDIRGAMVISTAYSHAGRFISGRAAVVKDGRWGAINALGAIIVPAEYDYLEIAEAGFILAARTGEGVWLMDLDGATLAFHEGEETFAAPVGNAYILYDGLELHLCGADGNILETISREGSVYEGLNGQWIIADGAWGEECVYLSGTNEKWQNLYPLGLAEGEALYACMQVPAARVVNDLLGEIQLAVDMESARYGVVNADGEALIPCEYERVEYLGNGRLLMVSDGLWQMADPSGKVYWSYTAKQSEEPSS